MFRHSAMFVALIAGAGLAAASGFESTLKVTGAVNLDVMTEAGGIYVTPGTAGIVSVRATLKAQLEFLAPDDVQKRIRELEQNPPIQRSGGTIRIGHVDPSMLKGVVMRLEITAPPDSQLKAQAHSGGVHIQGLRGAVDLTTKSGGVEALDMGGAVRVDGYSGGVEVSQTTAAPIYIRAKSGGVVVRLASGSGYDIHAVAESGKFKVPTIEGNVGRRNAQGKLRGGGPLVDVRATSGGITIE